LPVNVDTKSNEEGRREQPWMTCIAIQKDTDSIIERQPLLFRKTNMLVREVREEKKYETRPHHGRSHIQKHLGENSWPRLEVPCLPGIDNSIANHATIGPLLLAAAAPNRWV
jgi:hypothetical protein